MRLAGPLARLCVSPLTVPANWFTLPLRLIVGFGSIAHGYAKLARGPEVFIGIVRAIGTPFAHVLGWATIVVEIIGGSPILLRAWVPPLQCR